METKVAELEKEKKVNDKKLTTQQNKLAKLGAELKEEREVCCLFL